MRQLKVFDYVIDSIISEKHLLSSAVDYINYCLDDIQKKYRVAQYIRESVHFSPCVTKVTLTLLVEKL